MTSTRSELEQASPLAMDSALARERRVTSALGASPRLGVSSQFGEIEDARMPADLSSSILLGELEAKTNRVFTDDP